MALILRRFLMGRRTYAPTWDASGFVETFGSVKQRKEGRMDRRWRRRRPSRRTCRSASNKLTETSPSAAAATFLGEAEAAGVEPDKCHGGAALGAWRDRALLATEAALKERERDDGIARL